MPLFLNAVLSSKKYSRNIEDMHVVFFSDASTLEISSIPGKFPKPFLIRWKNRTLSLFYFRFHIILKRKTRPM